jgi:type VI secretion system secreted protein Hcp
MGLYMNYPGVKGDATESGFKDWITLQTVHFGSSCTIPTTAGREAGVSSINPVTVTKPLDAASAGLFRASVTRSQGQSVQIAFTETGAQGEPYLKYQLDDVLIAGYTISTSGDRPIENLVISCSKFRMTVTALFSESRIIDVSQTKLCAGESVFGKLVGKADDRSFNRPFE